ncbi:uncharacterized protein LOC132713046 [Ruditapes philippinarum]|uniref:uncharacterized protein LOC132713046 n=1 Tax=Ruditapes philippinarum TaxID=129788 RepID=UPI00295C3183|nr:uncharacterized protein LOC132713046 [Ruditapes philippinarum]
MEMNVRFKLVITFIVLNSAYVWSLKENNDISKRLSVLEDMLTEMESIVRETDVKVNKARDKVQDTEESIKRDFSRLEYSTERKQRRHYRRIEKEVKKELKHDSHILNEMIESIEQIQYRNVDNQTRDLTDTDNGLETMHHHVEMNVHQGIAHTEESRIMFKAVQINKRRYSDGETIIFSDVITNTGDGYDHKYGLFVTPLTGTYYFTVQLYILANRAALDIGIYVNDECIAWARLSHREDSCGNLAVVANLNLGDVVNVKQSSKSYSDTYKVDSNKFFNVFSGVFIR